MSHLRYDQGHTSPKISISSKTYFKDVTKRFARASGKTPSLEGTIYIKKKPTVLDGPVDKIESVGKSEVTANLPQQTKQIQTVQELPKFIPKETKVTTSIRTIPSETKTLTTSLVTTRTTPKLSDLSSTTQQIKADARTLTRTAPATKAVTQQKSITTLKGLEKLKQVPVLKTVTQTKTAPKLKEVTQLKPMLVTKQVPKLKQSTKLALKHRIPFQNVSKHF